MSVTGLVLAAGGSSRLGQPKQLLPFRGRPLLAATLDVARAAGFDQLIVTLGGSAAEIEDAVELEGVEVVHNVEFGTGCSSSISAALPSINAASDGVVLLLGDQPGVRPETIERLVSAASTAALGVCIYDDGRGHPFWLGREVYPDLGSLHGDKGVWKLLESGRHPVVEVDIEGPIPLDVDTWDDYERLVEHERGEGAR